MMNNVLRFFAGAMISLFSPQIFADTLPKGVGTIVIGGRQFVGEPLTYDEYGKSSQLGDRLNKDFSAESMRTGAGGKDLKKLYDNIKKFDSSQSGEQASIADELTLGKQTGIIKSQIDARYFGLGYGLSDQVTVIFGAPYISAAIAADIQFEGSNNALEIKNRLGDAAFDELKEGLDKASQVNREKILGTIHDEYNYKSIHKWTYQGFGDSFVGIRTGWDSRSAPNAPKYSLGFSAQMNLPTGPSYDPDALIQIPLSQEYYSLDLATDHKLTWTYMALGTELGVGFGLPATVDRRVPEDDESLINANRNAKVQLNPGIDTKASVYGITGNSTFRGQYKLGFDSHHIDSYSGSLPGNYEAMADSSAKQDIFHEASLIYTTVRKFKQKQFPIPFVLTFSFHDTITAVNATSKRYVELSFMTFFSTPWRADDIKPQKSETKSQDSGHKR